MQRAAAIFVAGMALGALILFAFLRSSRNETNAVAARSPAAPASNNSARTERTAQESSAEREKLILGNITTVPFQELYSVLSACSPQEMAALAIRFGDMPPGRETRTKVSAFFTAWAYRDANAALAAAVSLKTAEARNNALDAVIRGADVAAAKSLAITLNNLSPEALPPVDKARSLNLAVSKWSGVDPVAAAKFLDDTSSHDTAFFYARMMIAERWAAINPAAALAWAEAQSNPEERRMAISGMFSGWWESDPRAAEDYVASHLDSLGLYPVMQIAPQLFRQDPHRAQEWAAQLSTPEARRTAHNYIVMDMARTDPKAASQWAASLPEEVRRETLGFGLSQWTRTDAHAAALWLKTLEGAVRDEAVTTFGSTIAQKDPAIALSWIVTLSNEKTRSRMLNNIVTDWLRRSPAEAKGWIQNSPLPEPEKTRLLGFSTK